MPNLRMRVELCTLKICILLHTSNDTMAVKFIKYQQPKLIIKAVSINDVIIVRDVIIVSKNFLSDRCNLAYKFLKSTPIIKKYCSKISKVIYQRFKTVMF